MTVVKLIETYACGSHNYTDTYCFCVILFTDLSHWLSIVLTLTIPRDHSNTMTECEQYYIENDDF